MGPHKILSENGQIAGMELIHCVSVFDDQCVFNPSFDDTKEKIEGDQVVLAIGQASDLTFLGDDSQITVDRGLIVVDEDTLETGMKGVYAGGDVAAVPGELLMLLLPGERQHPP